MSADTNDYRQIIQGSNTPITLTFEEDVDFPSLVMSLWKNNAELKRWNIEDMEISGDTINLPLDEDETCKFPEGKIVLQTKGLDKGENVVFWEDIELSVTSRKDRIIDLID